MLSLYKYKFAIGYIVCVSLVSVIREKLMLQISPIIILFISSSFACIYFHLINYRRNANLYKKFINEKLFFIQLNLIVALMWVTTYYSIYFSSATVFVYEFFMVGGCLSLLFRKNKNISQKLASFLFIILICAPFLIYETHPLGILLGISAGIFGFIYNISSNKIALSLNLSASQILASRFWLLILLSAALLPKDFSQQLTLISFITIIGITVLSFILQIWLNQKSVITIGGQESSFISSFAPALTFIVQGVVLDNWFAPILILSLLGSGYIIYESILGAVLIRRRENFRG